MKFLLINLFFPPDGAPTGVLLADVAEALAAEGHEVHVLCAGAWYAYAGQASEFRSHGIQVEYVKAPSFGHGTLFRLSCYASFYWAALRRALFGMKYDVVLTLTTPPLLSLIGTLMKSLRGTRHYIWEMDLYPDIAVDLGFFRRGFPAELVVGLLADFSRRRADRVIALAESMRSRLLRRGIPDEKIAVSENWADGARIFPRPFPPDHPLTVLYSGNLGRAHDWETIADAMPKLSDASRYWFVFAGFAPRFELLWQRCWHSDVSNVLFLAYQEQDRISGHLGNCHVGLVTQKTETRGSVVPSKTYALMAAGRPFIFVGPAGGGPALVAERFGCGWRVEPGDAPALVQLIEKLAASPELVRDAGARAYAAFLEHYDVPHGAGRILEILGVSRAKGANEAAEQGVNSAACHSESA